MNTKKTVQEKEPTIDMITVVLITFAIAIILGIIALINILVSFINAPTVTFDSKWMESFAEENGEDVIYWEIDWVGDKACRKYEYTTNKKEKIHIYYECEDYSSGFEVVMNPETGRCTIWESGH